MQTVIARHAVVKSFTSRAEGAGHILYMDNIFSAPHLFDDLHMRAVNYCGTVRQNFKGMLGGFDSSDLEGQAVHVHMHKPPTQCNSCSKQWRVEDYSCSIGEHGSGQKIFHLSDLTMLNHLSFPLWWENKQSKMSSNFDDSNSVRN
jgi:hypothetical protein